MSTSIVALDIGTSKIAVIVGAITDDNEGIELIGHGISPSKGLQEGIIVNIDQATTAIAHAKKRAEDMIGGNIDSAFVGVSGKHISSCTADGRVRISRDMVSDTDLRRVKSSVLERLGLSDDVWVLHTLPKEYIVDSRRGIQDPRGMTGTFLDTLMHVITCDSNLVLNIEACLDRCQLKMDGVILEQYASAQAVLDNDELELGVCMIDIGHGTTDIAIFFKGALQHVFTMPIAGGTVTSDVAAYINVTKDQAELIKKEHGCALAKLAQSGEELFVPSTGGRPERKIERENLSRAIEMRYQEIFEVIKGVLEKNGYLQNLGAGIVLTGGGSRIEGLVDLAEEVFDRTARQGMPGGVASLHGELQRPDHATGIGLLNYAHRNAPDDKYGGNIINRTVRWVKSWYDQSF